MGVVRRTGGERVMVGLAGILVCLGAAACSSGSPTAARSTTTTSTTSTPSAAAGSQAAQLRALQSAVQSEKSATFKATYDSTGEGVPPNTVTIEQKPPKSLFSANGSVLLDNGSTTYYCSESGGQQTCLATTGGTNPLADVIQVYSGATALTLFQQWAAQLDARLAGVSVSFSNQTFAGQSAKCVDWSSQGQPAKYCVTSAGILAYAGGTGTSNGSFELTTYSTDVSEGDFNLPSGVTVQTLPSRVSAP